MAKTKSSCNKIMRLPCCYTTTSTKNKTFTLSSGKVLGIFERSSDTQILLDKLGTKS
ncbi:hypothetical protein [Facilibium subflavum]|uniref:hypothetical protein n=1 Tax=Facilibium subflavum TaxID=2219058 RepID=UPI0013C326FE|nr:hypothetical protein [Facilibium subflavum]